MTSPGLNNSINQEKRAQASLRATVVGLIANVLLASSKIAVGLAANSVSVLADGLNNFSDIGSVLVSFISLRLARKPRDKEHPFGHGRMEYIGSLAISMLILYIGIDLARTSWEAIRNPKAPIFTWATLLITAASIPVKLFLFFFYRRNGREYSISTLMASAQDSINDVMTTTVIVIGLMLSHFYGILIDAYLGLGVSLLIIWGGYKILRDTVSRLIGGEPDKALGAQAIAILRSYPEIMGLHDFVLHDYGPGRAYASVHAEVSSEASLVTIHEVIDRAEREIMDHLGLPINIHMDPVVTVKAGDNGPASQIADYLSAYDPPLSMHDFRVVPGQTVIKLIFDITIPADTQHKEADIIRDISAFAKSLDPRNRCIINIDHDYFDSIPQYGANH
ncbi:MAG: cation diffusion facilitator family transporter [Eubacteriales bacterium]|nr:cation diffusion facilitator family transporter [Eubacteriales bacterium]